MARPSSRLSYNLSSHAPAPSRDGAAGQAL
jgi:hypothetical protein